MNTLYTRRSSLWSGRSPWLVAGVLLGLAGGRLFPAAPATAQIPDAGAQRNALVAELKAANAKLDAFYQLVASGKVRVRVVEAPADSDQPGRTER